MNIRFECETNLGNLEVHSKWAIAYYWQPYGTHQSFTLVDFHANDDGWSRGDGGSSGASTL